MSLADYRQAVDRRLSEKAAARASVRQEKRALHEARELAKAASEAQQFLQGIAQKIQQHVHNRIAPVVTKCLAAVFEDPYEFKIVFEKKRGKTDARLVFIRDGHEVDPLTEGGGGVADIASLALRLSCIALCRLRLFLDADEPFRGVSPEYRHLVPEILMTLAKEMNFQILMATNFPEYRTGKVIRI